MSKYQKISDWCILSNETDGHMLEHAKTEILNCRWHEGYVDDIIMPYFLTSNRRTVIDIGASYGWMAVSFAKYFDKVNCFEIRDDVRYALRENTSRFPNVEIYNCGLSDKDANVRIDIDNTTTGTTKIIRERIKQPNKSGHDRRLDFGPAKEWNQKYDSSTQARVTTLDSFNFTNVDCIKMDIENHEYYALLGAIKTIKKWKPVLILEISYTAKRYFELFEPRQRIFKLLHSLDYQMVDARGRDFIFSHKTLA